LLNPVKPDAVRFMPPLTINKKEIDEAVRILDKVFEKV
jgi:4-aminobutyrate aminotransferase-like enzyme